MGHLFGPNPERGLYKSIDGGKNWKKAKFIDNNTGFTDLAIDPSNPKIIYAASYQRQRTWWGYNGGGPGSGLWKSTDGGDTWTRIEGPGWPKPADGLYGRIAISLFRARPSTIYAQVEVGASAGQAAAPRRKAVRRAAAVAPWPANRPRRKRLRRPASRLPAERRQQGMRPPVRTWPPAEAAVDAAAPRPLLLPTRTRAACSGPTTAGKPGRS